MARNSLMLRPLAISSLLFAPAVRSFGSSSSATNRGPGRALRAAPDAATWTPCAQPSFNEFAECTVGPWITPPSTAMDEATPTEAATPRVQEVEEVMRSCGGAVQGIRELPLSLVFETDEAAPDDRAYHNRADGGFVYADDGSYSAGPERWDWNADDRVETASDAQFWMASLAFPDRRRAWITANPSEASGTEDATRQLDPKVLELSRPWSTPDDGDDDLRAEIESDPSQLPRIHWKAMQRARMPNSNQPWSLARAKWEKRVIESDEGSDGDVPKVKSGPLIGCMSIQSISENEGKRIFGDVAAADAIAVRMLAACPASRVARAAVRCYGPDGSLKSVAFLEGSL